MFIPDLSFYSSLMLEREICFRVDPEPSEGSKVKRSRHKGLILDRLVLTFPQSHGSDSVRDFVAGEQDEQRPAGLRQQVQVHLQRGFRCHGDCGAWISYQTLE